MEREGLDQYPTSMTSKVSQIRRFAVAAVLVAACRGSLETGDRTFAPTAASHEAMLRLLIDVPTSWVYFYFDAEALTGRPDAAGVRMLTELSIPPEIAEHLMVVYGRHGMSMVLRGPFLESGLVAELTSNGWQALPRQNGFAILKGRLAGEEFHLALRDGHLVGVPSDLDYVLRPEVGKGVNTEDAGFSEALSLVGPGPVVKLIRPPYPGPEDFRHAALSTVHQGPEGVEMEFAALYADATFAGEGRNAQTAELEALGATILSTGIGGNACRIRARVSRSAYHELVSPYPN